eukprot:TRINITY_DN135061_c2_g1_i1.p1 TRINITY_DN135061_c2_g1~~TRINITY_DN135061_c2_g1_i1.p1  ORF type:complete len:1050 (-),score=86.24 TRINITY_DN135061_c2_g1_i1:7026-10100(-)
MMLSTIKTILKANVRLISKASRLPIPKQPRSVLAARQKQPPAIKSPPVVKEETALTDFELHAHLRSTGQLPEQQLEKVLQNGYMGPEVVTDILQALPSMMTPSVIGICETCSQYPSLTKSMKELWVGLEFDLYDRFNSMTNEHIVTILASFSKVNKGSPQLYKKFEEIIIDTEIPFKPKQLVSILSSYSQMNYGSPLFLSTLSSKLTHAGKVEINDGVISNTPTLSLAELAKAAYKISGMKNNMQGGYGLYKTIDKRVRASLAENKLNLGELANFIEYYFAGNLGSNELQKMIELEVVNKVFEMNVSTLIKIVAAIPYYKIKTEEFSGVIQDYVEKWLPEFSDTQLAAILKAFTKNKALKYNKSELVQVATNRAITFKSRHLAEIAEGFTEISLEAKEKENLYAELEKSAKSKIAKFTVHDLIKIQQGFERAKTGTYSFHVELLSEIRKRVDLFKYKDCIGFIYILKNFPDEWNKILDEELWKVIYQKLISAADACIPEDCAKMLEVCKLVNLPSGILVIKAMKRLEEDAQTLSDTGFCMALKYLVEFGSKKLENFENIFRLLMKSNEYKKYAKRFSPEELVTVLHSALMSNKELLIEITKDMELINQLLEYDVEECIKSRAEYIRVVEAIKTKLPEELIEKYKKDKENVLAHYHEELAKLKEERPSDIAKLRTQIKEDVKRIISEHSKECTVVENYIDDAMNIADVAIFDKDKVLKHAVLIYGKEDYMAHDPGKLYKSAEMRKAAFQGKTIVVDCTKNFTEGYDKIKETIITKLLSQYTLVLPQYYTIKQYCQWKKTRRQGPGVHIGNQKQSHHQRSNKVITENKMLHEVRCAKLAHQFKESTQTVPCEICSRSVPQNSYYVHLESHFSERAPPHVDPGIETIVCDICRETVPFQLYEQHMSHHDKNQEKPQQHDASVLPRIKYEGKGEDKECKICFSDYKIGDTLVYLKCMHKFHERCFMEWVKERAICPICKCKVLDQTTLRQYIVKMHGRIFLPLVIFLGCDISPFDSSLSYEHRFRYMV